MNVNTETTVSDNRNSRVSQPIETPTNMSQSQYASTSTSQTYSTAAKTNPQAMFPKKDQAIVMHAIEPYKLSDYVKSLGTLITPKNIIFASRISNNRICIYLSSRQMVDNLLKTHNKIKIEETEITIRRLITPAKRIIISNVCPSIPHDFLETVLINSGLSLVSPISFLRAGIPGDEFSHILSFRRQVYVSPNQEENRELQTSMLITYEETNYRIFLSSDNMECYICKKSGHIASNCPNADEQFPTLTDIQTQSSKKRPAPASSPTPTEQNVAVQNLIDMETTPTPPKFKSPTTTHHLKDSKPDTETELQMKKLKKSTSTDSITNKEAYDSIQDIINKSPAEYILSSENFRSFLENSHGNNDPISEARRFTSDIRSLLNNMQTIYSQLSNRSMRNRFTRLSKKIKKQLQEEGFEVESLMSCSSQDTDRINDFSDCPANCSQ